MKGYYYSILALEPILGQHSFDLINFLKKEFAHMGN